MPRHEFPPNLNENNLEHLLDDIQAAQDQALELEHEKFRESVSSNLLNTIGFISMPLPLYSIVCGVSNIMYWYYANNKPGGRTLFDHIKLLSSATLFSTSVVNIQKIALGSTSNSLFFIGLAVDAGIDFVITLHQLSTQWKTGSALKKTALVFNTVSKALLFCSWVSMGVGCSSGAIFLLAACTMPFVQMLSPSLMRDIFRSNNTIPPQGQASSPDLGATQPLEGEFKAFSGTPYRLGS
ncbi:MAG: hypothetical protein K0R24_2167 [Gammaproteobacteria bacterium]|jgi:hypothetical protein|nr:hypothetical protein [Gammaproteobacteria bacterium]